MTGFPSLARALVASLVFGLMLPVAAHADPAGIAAPSPSSNPPASPAGRWRIIDDETGQQKGVIRIMVRGDTVTGALEAPQSHDICTACGDDRRNHPIDGLEIIRGARRDGDRWTDGTILNPNNGKTYGVDLSVAEGGRVLRVRGYLGISLLGRTQSWTRLD
jgi:uncharacterized protein (DUF2147 family)